MSINRITKSTTTPWACIGMSASVAERTPGYAMTPAFAAGFMGEVRLHVDGAEPTSGTLLGSPPR